MGAARPPGVRRQSAIPSMSYTMRLSMDGVVLRVAWS